MVTEQQLNAVKDLRKQAEEVLRGMYSEMIREKLETLEFYEEVKLYDPRSEVGLGGFSYHDVMECINSTGQGIMYNSTSFLNKAYELPVNIYKVCDAVQLEQIWYSVLQHVKDKEHSGLTTR